MGDSSPPLFLGCTARMRGGRIDDVSAGVISLEAVSVNLQDTPWMSTLQDLLRALAKLIGILGSRFISMIRKHPNTVRTILLLIVVVVVGWNAYRHALTRNITILSGPFGGSGYYDARKMANQIEQSSRFFGESFRVEIQPTAGFEANRREIAADPGGKTIAFAHDGFGDSETVRVLLPLEYNYLHIICHESLIKAIGGKTPERVAGRPVTGREIIGEFYIDSPQTPNRDRGELSENSVILDSRTSTSSDLVPLTETSPIARNLAGKIRLELRRESEPSPVTFDQVLGLLQKGRVYFGPQNSGTQQMAHLVARHFQLDISRLASYNFTSFEDMRVALLRGDIDVAFYCGPLNAEIMQSVARDGLTELVGLNPGDQKAILQGRPYLRDAMFTKNSYVHGGFCPEEMGTIASRRVIICSHLMGKRLAFFLASHSFDSLRDRFPELQWGGAQVQTTSGQLAYRIHPGAEWLRDNKEAPWIPPSLQSVIYLLFIWSGTEILAAVSHRLKQQEADGVADRDDRKAALPSDMTAEKKHTVESASQPADRPIVASPSPMFAKLQRKVEFTADQLESLSTPILGKRRRQWIDKLEQLRATVRQARDEGSISENEFASLLVGIEMELRPRFDRDSSEAEATEQPADKGRSAK